MRTIGPVIYLAHLFRLFSHQFLFYRIANLRCYCEINSFEPCHPFSVFLLTCFANLVIWSEYTEKVIVGLSNHEQRTAFWIANSSVETFSNLSTDLSKCRIDL